MKLKIKIAVFLTAVSPVVQACRKHCKTPNFDGNYAVTIQYSWSKQGGFPPVTPYGWDTSYTDVLKVHSTSSPYDLSVENWPVAQWNGMSKTTTRFALKSGDSNESNVDTEGKKSKKCFENAFWEPEVSGSNNSHLKMVVGQGSFSYDYSRTIGGSSGFITETWLIKGNR